MMNLKEAAEVVIPVLVLAALLAGVMLDYKRRLRVTARKAKSRR
ncbi:hypothetical protein pEpSNUABM08_74 [Erwinia phage pEp_SNUABM_08]|uniref:Uncharacterized protein n=1 Tax=Erwinia phage pEp_SNUABM_08 TaxID=2593268 RepID=A0A5J6DAS4_9CAUD|nr:hypothetical protein JT353_gp74 [Erwinia phage pEp_SNUABM_08]QEQ94821.1 hypothetical protein pEpSNUABM08_74 [Erwinia phage pEp_SNUABM_08]